MPVERCSRRQLLRWVGWFGTANAAVYAVILLRYLWRYPFSSDLIGNIYILLAFVGHAAFLAFLPLILLVIPLLLVWPLRRPVTAIAVILASIVAGLLLLDTNVFAQNRYHLTWLTFAILERSTLAFGGLFLLVALAFESMLSGLVWRRLTTGAPPLRGRWPAIVFAGCLIVSQFVHIWADAVGHTPVVQFTRYMPFYMAGKAKSILRQLNLVDPDQVQNRRALYRSVAATDGELNYPLNPLHCRSDNTTLPNILIVLMDALRPDTVLPGLMPEVAGFSRNAAQFTQHFSGGNSTRMGVFSMFYGLPVTYWQSFYALQRSPVLMDQVRDNGYQMGLFSAIGFGSPTSSDRTVFVSWPGLPSHGDDVRISEQNRRTTDNWLAWLKTRDARQPFFGYLHYTPPNSEMSAEKLADAVLPIDTRFESNPGAQDAWMRYRRAIRTLDDEFGRVMDSLQSESLVDDTIIIVTSDHGNEFDDNGNGYMGNGTAFSSAQLLATMIVAWPGREPAEYRHRTSHYDLPVTLLQDVFGCDNPPRDYGIGRNLFAGDSWSWIISGSYSGHAIVQPDQVIISHPGGYVEVRDQTYRPISEPKLDAAVIEDSMESQSRFFK